MPRKILIVEDEPNVLALLEARLKLNKYAVASAADGKTGWESLKREKPDLVILDVNIPPPNGFQLCRTIKDDPEVKNTPVILLTARATPSDKFWGTESGADAYLTKPYDPNDLLAHIRSLLREE